MSLFQRFTVGCLGALIVLTLLLIAAIYFGPSDKVLEIRITTARELNLVGQIQATPTPTRIAPTATPRATSTPSRTPTATVSPLPSAPPLARPTATPVVAAAVPSLVAPSRSSTRVSQQTARVSGAKISPTPAPAGVSYASAEALCVRLINQARQRAGLPAFSRDPALDEVARERSQDMAKRGYFSHEDPAGGTLPLERLLLEHHVDYRQAGENIAYFLGPTQADVLPELSTEKWLQSAPHQKNIMDPNYNVTGFGIVGTSSKEGRIWYLTQVFVQR